MRSNITVLGAGIIGISCAFELQRRGFKVTLIDRRGPGEETSYGNAGVLSYSNITPLARPELISRAHRLLLNRDTDLLLHYPHLMKLLPWLARFALRCRRSIFLRDGQAMSALTLPSIELHRQWIRQCNAQHLLNPVGVLKLYRKHQSFMRDQLERDLYDLCEIKYSLLDPGQIHEREPDLHAIFVKAVMIDESLSLRDPGKLCQAYTHHFLEAGGLLQRADIHALSRIDNRWELSGNQGLHQTDKLVVCLGAWTAGIIGQLGYRNPIAIERGYHTIFTPMADKKLSRPIFDVDASYVMAPMEMGLRVSTGSNLTYGEARENHSQVTRISPHVHEAFPVDQVILDKPWMGRRPTTPDTLPIIGPAPAHENLWLAYAHSHMGLTMGPMTAQLIANFVSGDKQPIPVAAYAPQRYL